MYTKYQISQSSSISLFLPFRIQVLLAFFIAMVAFGGQAIAQADDGKQTVLRLYPEPDNPRNSEGDFITLKDGRIMFIYSHYTGTSGDDNGSAYLAGRYSSDQGKSWTTKDEKIVEQEGTMNVMSVSLLRLQNGEIALFYLKKNSETDCIPIIRISNDEAKTWSNPRPCITDKEGYFVLHSNRVIQLQNGRIVFAVSEESKFYTDCLWSYYSDDNGRTWKPGSEVPNPKNVLHQEPGVVQLKDGKIFMIIRSDAGVQYKSYSKDKGETWSPSERSNIYSPVSPASVALTPSTGDLLLVWNNNNGDNPIIKGKRTPLNIGVSKDDGQTWELMKTIEEDPDGSYCYTAIHFTEKNVLIAYFDWATRQTTVRRLSRAWVYN